MRVCVRAALLAAALVPCASLRAALSSNHTFESFIQAHGRSYQAGSAQYNERRDLFEKVRTAVAEQNNRPNRLWTAGVNKLSDWSVAELRNLRGWDGRGSTRSSRHQATFLQQRSELPKEKIWSNLAATKNIRDQGACGSCWAIAVSTVLGAHAEIHTGKPRTFSAQQIVSCTPNPRQCGGDGACKGATAELALDWVLHHGCAEESEVPYAAHDGECTNAQPSSLAGLQLARGVVNDDAGNWEKYLDNDINVAPSSGAAFGMTGWETLPKNTYEPLARALAESGPVAVSVGADAWQSYDSGIFDGCGKDAIIDHAVVAIGYGEEDGNKYWVIQNSWGADWGEDGHIRLQRHDADEYCGMDNKPEVGVACKGETDPQPVCGMCGVLFDSTVPHFG